MIARADRDVMAATELDTGMLLHIEAIYNGDAACHCGADAVLIVTTEPDLEPGPSCCVHAWEWIDASLGIARKIYGPPLHEE